jgi:hypothetical protein
MDWAIYGTLIAGFVAIAAGAGFLVVRALDTWRMLKRFRRSLETELERVTELADAAAEKAERSDQQRLDASIVRLRGGLAQLSVLLGALDEVGETFGRIAAVYPRK